MRIIACAVFFCTILEVQCFESSDCSSEEKKMKYSPNPLFLIISPSPPTTAAPIKLPWGPFYEFVLYSTRAVQNASTHHNQRDRVTSYLQSLSKALRGLGPKPTIRSTLKKISKGSKRLADKNETTIQTVVNTFYGLLTNMTVNKRNFFMAMNRIYDPYKSLKFEDYVYDLKQYLKGYTNRIGKETREVFEDVVFYEYYKQDHNFRYEVETLFNSAYEEFLMSDIQLSVRGSTEESDGGSDGTLEL